MCTVRSKKPNKNILMSPTGFIIIPLQYLWRRFLLSVRNKSQGVLCSARNGLACVASVSVWFRSRERPKNGIFGFGRRRNGTRANKLKRGEGRGRKETGFPSFLLHPLPALLLSRSLTLAPRSLLRNRTEMLATQARNG